MSLDTPGLHTSRLQLRPFTDADADATFAPQSSAHVLRYWDAPPWTERDQATRFIAARVQMAAEGTGVDRLAIDRVADGAFIGWCTLSRCNPDYRSASIGYCLGDAAWGHGHSTEASTALLQWAFDTLGLNRVQAGTDTRHLASDRVLEKLGFVRQERVRGLHRERRDLRLSGVRADQAAAALIRGGRPAGG